jgi:hypothetical protein
MRRRASRSPGAGASLHASSHGTTLQEFAIGVKRQLGTQYPLGSGLGRAAPHLRVSVRRRILAVPAILTSVAPRDYALAGGMAPYPLPGDDVDLPARHAGMQQGSSDFGSVPQQAKPNEN